MADGSYSNLVATLDLAMHEARDSGREQYVWQLPDGEWWAGPVIPAECIYLRVTPDGAATGCCDACERVRMENEQARHWQTLQVDYGALEAYLDPIEGE